MIGFIENNIFSIVTAIIAIIAIWQTHLQIKISNKQHLFNKRVEKYTITNNLINLYVNNKMLLDYSDSKKNEAITVDFQFENLTNIGYLKDITDIIYDPKNNDKKTRFLLKLEDLDQLANEMKFLFKNKQILLLNDFIINYKNVLLELYKYQIIQDLMKNNSNIINMNKTYEELQKEYGELKHRFRLYKAIDSLKNSYDNIIAKDVLNKIEKEIKI